MKNKSESQAIAIARAHVEAFSNHDYETTRKLLAEDVHFTVITTEPNTSNLDGIGVEKFMEEITKFASIVIPGSTHIIESAGDDRHALIMVTVKASLSSGAVPVTILAARHYLLDENNKIKVEQVIFFTISDK